MRRLADDLRAEEERLQNAHLTRLRRAVASEVAGDTAAKAATLGWLHGALSEDERERLEHWTGLLARVLALQQEHGYWGDKGGDQQAHNSVDDDAAAGAAVDSQVDTDPAVDAATAAADAAAGPPKEAAYDGDVMTWVARPAHHRHHLRVALECLKELGAEDLPVRALLTLKARERSRRPAVYRGPLCLNAPLPTSCAHKQPLLHAHTHAQTDILLSLPLTHDMQRSLCRLCSNA